MEEAESPEKAQFAYQELFGSPFGDNVLGYVVYGKVAEKLQNMVGDPYYSLKRVSQKDYVKVALAIHKQEDSSRSVFFLKSIDDIVKVKATSVKLADVELKK
jgi:hypothetical protein